jgi:hypothetical protein
MSADLVECRIPSCRRPELLRRALRSLCAQTHEAWRAVVLDDSPAGDAATVVQECADPRVTHRHNPRPLGAAVNIDSAFNAQPMLDGRFAFVLEDDNAVDPTFMATGVQRLLHSDVDVLSFNQRSVRFDADGAVIPIGILRPDQFLDELWTSDRTWLNAFLGFSLPNGGYFWRLGRKVDLTVGPGVREPQLQECVRQTRLTAITLLAEPLSVWSYLPSAKVRRQIVSHRRFSVSLNNLSQTILAQMGEERLLGVARRETNPAVLRRVEQSLAELSLLPPRRLRRFSRAPLAALRCWLRHQFYRDSTLFDQMHYPILP